MKLFVFLFFSLLIINVKGQDIIVKIDKSEIKAKVIEINDYNIKYYDFDNLDGPIRYIKVLDVFMIIYENGKKEYFNKDEDLQNLKYKYKKGNYFSPSIGYGSLYGGQFGVNLQYTFLKNGNISINGGIGYFSKYKRQFINYSLGGKFYATIRPPYTFMHIKVFINPQYGIYNIGFKDVRFDGLGIGPQIYKGYSLSTGIEAFFSKRIAISVSFGLAFCKIDGFTEVILLRNIGLNVKI